MYGYELIYCVKCEDYLSFASGEALTLFNKLVRAKYMCECDLVYGECTMCVAGEEECELVYDECTMCVAGKDKM
jgi:hypothetical protein